MVPLVQGLVRGLNQFGRRIEVRESLGQVDAVAGHGDSGHFPDDGFGKMFDAFGRNGHVVFLPGDSQPAVEGRCKQAVTLKRHA
jgi:hypothetical protein